MFKVTPNPPDSEPGANIMATPRTPSTMFIVNPELSTETLLVHACESLASANVMVNDLVDHLEGQAAMRCWGLRR